MAHFYGTLQGNRGQATRCGSKDSGVTTVCASWSGAVRCEAYQEERSDGVKEDWVVVSMIPWHGAGANRVLYRGPIGEFSGAFSVA